MAIANKTRWTEKWHAGGGVQVVNCKVVEDANYNESIMVTLYPIKAFEPQAPKVITRTRADIWELLDKLEADRSRATATV